MADHDEVLPEETSGYKLSQPKQSLAEYQQMGELSSCGTILLCPAFSCLDLPMTYNAVVECDS